MTAPIRSLSLPVEGMTCASCVRRVEKAIAAVPGVTGATVNLATGRADVAFTDPAALEGVRAAVAKAGYEMPLATQELVVEGATCASCVRRIETALGKVPGVTGAVMNLATGQARVEGSADVAPADLIAAVTAAGYSAHAATPDAPHSAPHGEVGLRRLILAAALTLPVFVVEMGGHMGLGHWTHAAWVPWAEALLTTLVLAGPGRLFFVKGIPGLLRGHPDMNALVALGAGAAWLYSMVVVLAPGLLPETGRHIYFEAAAVIVTLILLGRFLEARAKGRAGEAIARLVDLAPTTARVIRGDAVVEVPVAEVSPGDLIQLRPGERVAVDGKVETGESWIDEAMLTGEPEPVAKHQGDGVSAGTVNTTGTLSYRAEAVGRQTRLARILATVEAAQAAKLPVQDMVDRITSWFVPAVITVAVLTALVWLILGPSPAQALVAGVSVIIIACPCAMGLAVPVSILVGSGRGAELGVLFRRGDALQALAEVDRVAFDKTGTLTAGHPQVTDVIGDDSALALAAAVEATSEHPLAQAILAEAERRGLTVPAATGFRSVTGQGAVADVEGRRVAVGNARLMQAEGAEAPEAEMTRLSEAGRTPVLVAVDGRHVATLGLSDPPREGAAETVAGLAAMGLGTAMLTGDTERTARAIAARLGVAEIHAALAPEDKLATLRRMQAEGAKVAFVGDGINDAPVLAGADVGIAIGTGTDVAIEAAEVVLMSGDPRGVLRATGLSRAVMRNIRQNLAWAFGYNVLLIPVAAGALYPAFGILLSPALAAGAMALSSVLVVTNALRLKRWSL